MRTTRLVSSDVTIHTVASELYTNVQMIFSYDLVARRISIYVARDALQHTPIAEIEGLATWNLMCQDAHWNESVST